MSYIFVSYSKRDIDFARYLRGLLQDAGYAVWMDEARLVPSQRWWPTIEQHIKDAALFMVIMSPNAEQSQWVEREILVAENHARPILPILYTGKPWTRLGNIQYEDMTAGLNAVLSPAMIHALTSAGLQPSEAFHPTAPQLTPKPINSPIPPSSKFPLTEPRAIIIAAIIGLIGIILAAIITGAFGLNQPSSPTAVVSAPTTVVLTLTAIPPTATDLPTLTPVPPTETPAPSPTPTASATPTIDAGATSAAQAAATLTVSYLQVQSIAVIDLTSTALLWINTPVSTATQITRPASQATSTSINGYPCNAEIVFRRSGLLNIVRGGPSSTSSYRSPIQQGSAISILSKDQESANQYWYQVADSEGNILGWIPTDYAILSEHCPS